MKRTVTLQPGESKEISFSYTPTVPGSYIASVNGLAKSFTVLETPAVPFTFSNASVEQVIMQSAPAWNTIIFRCRVTNPGSRATELLKVMWRFRQYRPTYGEWGSWQYPSPLGSFELTLNPGQSYDFVWNGNEEIAPGTVKGPNIGANTQHCVWLEDELGNASEQVCVTRGY